MGGLGARSVDARGRTRAQQYQRYCEYRGWVLAPRAGVQTAQLLSYGPPVASPLMTPNANALQWDGKPGHYEVYYLSATDRVSRCGLWIRYTMVAPLLTKRERSGAEEATCSLW